MNHQRHTSVTRRTAVAIAAAVVAAAGISGAPLAAAAAPSSKTVKVAHDDELQCLLVIGSDNVHGPVDLGGPRRMNTNTSIAVGAALVLALAACGDDSDTDAAAASDELCALATELFEQDDFPSVEQLQRYQQLAPESIADAVHDGHRSR